MPEAASLTVNNPMMVKIVSVDIICQMVPLALLCYLKLSITLHLDRIHGVHTFSSAAKLLFFYGKADGPDGDYYTPTYCPRV